MSDICSIFLIVGSIIGAGFATGREIVVFYVQYGFMGSLGIVLSCVLFARIFYVYLSNKPQAKFQKIFSIIILICLIVMSGGLIGACKEINMKLFNAGIDYIGIMTVLICGVLVLFDIDKISRLCFVIVPILIIISVTVSIIGCFKTFNLNNNLVVFNNNSFMVVFKSISYVGLNTMMASSVVFDIGSRVNNKKIVSVWAGVLFGVIVLISAACIFVSGEVTINSIMPIYTLSKSIGQGWSLLYLLSLWLAIVSSLITTIYGVQKTFDICINSKFARVIISILICYVVSFIGFESIVGVLYPVIGVLGIAYYIYFIKCIKIQQTK